MRYDTRIVTAPTGLPLHLDHIKRHLGIYDTDRDLLIPGWVRSAWEDAEAVTNRVLLHTRYALTLRAFPCKSMRVGNAWAYLGIVLPHAPLVRVVSVEYVDGDGATQTMSTSDYVTNRTSLPAFIAPAYGANWPATRDQDEAVIITYDAGYASPAAADATANTITVTGPVTWAVDAAVRFSNSGGVLPAPLAADTDYYVKTAPGAGVYTLAATSGGTTIDITDAGTGTHFIGAAVPSRALQWMLLHIGEQDANREKSVVVERGQYAKMDFADHLLDTLEVYLP